MHRRVFLLSVVAAALPFLASAPPLSAALPDPCAGQTYNHFLGNGRSSAGLKGVYGEIERINEILCTQGATKVGSWSLAWVSLDGPQSPTVPGIDIYQGGYAQCPPADVGSCPYNNGANYLWIYYAREQGACGAAFNTGFINQGNSTSGYHFFQASKVGGYYNFYIDEVFKHARLASDIDTCWPGVSGVEWQDEMLNDQDQGGGHVSNPQGWRNNQYQNATGWHNADRTLNSNCDANSFPAHWHCVTSATNKRAFDTWDDRVP